LRPFFSPACAVFGPWPPSGAPRPTPKHGIAMYGEPSLPPDFVALPYANPDAPKGGRVVFGEVGGFDSLNPFILKGARPGSSALHMYEGAAGPELGRTVHALRAAGRIGRGAGRPVLGGIHLRDEARFSDGSPVTVDDVIWSFETLGTEGHPRYANAWGASRPGRGDRPAQRPLHLQRARPRMPLIAVCARSCKRRNGTGGFAESGLDVPVATGPYVIDRFEPGASSPSAATPTIGAAICPSTAGATISTRSAMSITATAPRRSRRSRPARSPSGAKTTPRAGQRL
jgi:peptide/nickel transport system substrate-binding protein